MKSLAVVLRPRTLDQVFGQRHLIGEGKVLRKLIELDKLTSAIFYGPPGTGKTSVAEIIAHTTNSNFIRFNATSANVASIRKEGQKAIKSDTRSIMFVDEIHRFSKTQQDVLLPFVEDGYLCLIGTTTENPFHSINSALISRSQIFKFEPLSEEDLIRAVYAAIKYYRSEGNRLEISLEAIKHIVRISCGDARKAIGTLEMAFTCSAGLITKEIVEEIAPSKYIVFGKDDHFDLASAFQGAIQASDADAAIFWLARWLESGEDPRYIARRLMVSASEDAACNPECALIAQAAYVAACEVGRPECDIIFSHATILIAEAPRNKRAAQAIWAAVADIKNNYEESHYQGAKNLGNGKYHDRIVPDAYIGVKKKYVN